METRTIADKARIVVAKDMTDITMSKLLKALYMKSHLMYTHSINVAYLTAQILIAKKTDKKLAKKIILGALLHDIGKIEVPDDILNKKGSLTSREYELIKLHPQYGVNIIKKEAPELYNDVIVDIILNHHERRDGSGYPHGIKKISWYTQLVHAIDIYDAITSERKYADAKTSDTAFSIMENEGIKKSVIKDILKCQIK